MTFVAGFDTAIPTWCGETPRRSPATPAATARYSVGGRDSLHWGRILSLLHEDRRKANKGVETSFFWPEL